MNVLSAVMSAFVQLGLLLVLPVAWWALTARGRLDFATWIGLHMPRWRVNRRRTVAAVLAWVLVSTASIMLLRSLGEDVAASRFAGMGLAGVVPVTLHALVQTGLSEEIFFRGFLGKRLIAGFGFAIGNVVQAVVFGLVHVGFFASSATPTRLALIGVITAANAWIMGWINERCAGGSIVPSWMLHSTVNLAVGLGAAFTLPT